MVFGERPQPTDQANRIRFIVVYRKVPKGVVASGDPYKTRLAEGA